MDVKDLQKALGVTADGLFGPRSRAALFAHLSNRKAPAITDADFAKAAADLGVSEKMIRAVRKVEAPRGAFDDQGRPSILYERHVFSRNTKPKGKFDSNYPSLSSGKGYGPGGYGAFSEQYDKLGLACALDPEAAFKGCSWGAFQILGENAKSLGYKSAFHMAEELTKSEAAHLDSFVRFVKANGLADELRACKPGNPQSCIPFVMAYNGPGYSQFGYHTKLAQAAL